LRWIKGITKPAGVSQVNIEPSPHFSYFLGALLGDGNIRKVEKSYKYEIRLRVKDREFAEKFAEAFLRWLISG